MISIIVICFLISFLFTLGLWARAKSATTFLAQNAIVSCHELSSSIQQNKKIKLMSYNIGYASAEKNNLGNILKKKEVLENLSVIAHNIKSHSPDIVLLQEVDFFCKRSHQINQLNFLAQKLGYAYFAYTITWNKNYVPWPFWPPQKHFGKMLSGQAILSQHPILWESSQTLKKPLNKAFWYNTFYLDRIVQQVEVQFSWGNLSLYHIHLEAFDENTRIQQLKSVEEQIVSNSNKYKIIGGDFNIDSNENSLLLKNFSNKTQMNHFKNFAHINTFSSWKPHQAIDHIFCSSQFKIEDAGVLLNSKGSDHLPIFIKLSVQ